jgi:hypothetical protein
MACSLLGTQDPPPRQHRRQASGAALRRGPRRLERAHQARTRRAPQFSNHTGYPTVKGKAFSGDDLLELLEVTGLAGGGGVGCASVWTHRGAPPLWGGRTHRSQGWGDHKGRQSPEEASRRREARQPLEGRSARRHAGDGRRPRQRRHLRRPSRASTPRPCCRKRLQGLKSNGLVRHTHLLTGRARAPVRAPSRPPP